MKAPSLLIGHRSVNSFFKSSSGVFSKREVNAFSRLASKSIPPVTSLKSLAMLFQFSQRFVFAMARRPKKYYRSFTIHKGTKLRRIDAPKVALKVIQSWLGYNLSRAVILDDCVHGFVPGRSTVSAAQIHCGANWILTIDIKDFFPSINATHVAVALRGVGYSLNACRLLARLLTLNNALPQGSPASPVLANLVFRKTDIQLQKLASKYELRYTRYADDLCFSSSSAWLGNEFIEEVKAILKKNNWNIATKKTRLVKAPHRLLVLGLIVNGEKPKLTKSMRNKVRLAEFLLNADFEVVNKEKLRGYISYANSVDAVSN